jgi:hypothetical protein
MDDKEINKLNLECRQLRIECWDESMKKHNGNFDEIMKELDEI